MRALLTALFLAVAGVQAHAESGMASVDYGRPTRFDGGHFRGLVATGERFKASIFAVAHCSLPLGSRVMIRFRARTAEAIVKDRGPCCTAHCRRVAPARLLARVIDLTPALAAHLRFPGLGRVSFWPVA